MAQGAKDDTASIKIVIDNLFLGMKEGDSAKVHGSFSDYAVFNSIYKTSENGFSMHKESLESFLDAVGAPHKEIWNEKLLSYTYNIDYGLAHVWTEYEFYVNDQFSHCGVNSFTLTKENDSWKILSITDTRRKKPCFTN